MTAEVARSMTTKRKFAYELYPHPKEEEIRPLAVEVPYLLAAAIGMRVSGTGWMDEPEQRKRDYDRINQQVQVARLALLADALLQGLSGDEAWTWATARIAGDNLGEWLFERSQHYGVDFNAIKPYPCGPEPRTHVHYTAPGTGSYVDGRESECPECTEPIEAAS